MSSDLSVSLRQLIAERARYRCEYCLLPQAGSMHRHEPDHIISRQHDGETREDNLAFACFRCNRYKGPNVGSFDPLTGALVSLFNPRTQRWEDHFKWEAAVVQALSPEGRVTVKLLRFNETDRVMERQRLRTVGLYF
jgi:5-methylcytosine-specific restriction endonuclease McrA